MAWTHLRRLEVYRGQSSLHETQIKIEKVQTPKVCSSWALLSPRSAGCWYKTGVICAQLLRKWGEETPQDKSACSSPQESGVKPVNKILNNHLKGIPGRFCQKYFAFNIPRGSPRGRDGFLSCFHKQLLVSCIFHNFLLMATV